MDEFIAVFPRLEFVNGGKVITNASGQHTKNKPDTKNC